MGGLEGCGRSKMEDWGGKRRTHLRAKIFVESRQINNSWTRHFRGTKTHLSLVLYSPVSGSLSSFLVERDPTKATFPSPVGQSHPISHWFTSRIVPAGTPPTCRTSSISVFLFDRHSTASTPPHLLPTSFLLTSLRFYEMLSVSSLFLASIPPPLSLSPHFTSSRLFFLPFLISFNLKHEMLVEMLFYL